MVAMMSDCVQSNMPPLCACLDLGFILCCCFLRLLHRVVVVSDNCVSAAIRNKYLC
jgi:hypothetical protein